MSSTVWRAVAESARSRSRSTFTVSPSPDSSSNCVSPCSRSLASRSASAGQLVGLAEVALALLLEPLPQLLEGARRERRRQLLRLGRAAGGFTTRLYRRGLGRARLHRAALTGPSARRPSRDDLRRPWPLCTAPLAAAFSGAVLAAAFLARRAPLHGRLLGGRSLLRRDFLWHGLLDLLRRRLLRHALLRGLGSQLDRGLRLAQEPPWQPVWPARLGNRLLERLLGLGLAPFLAGALEASFFVVERAGLAIAPSPRADAGCPASPSSRAESRPRKVRECSGPARPAQVIALLASSLGDRPRAQT